jgi:polycomb protein EED
MRFKLFFVPGHHPVLAFCNASGKIFFWDLERLVGYHEYKRALVKAGPDPDYAPTRPSWLAPILKRGPRGGGAATIAEPSKVRGNITDKDSTSELEAPRPSTAATPVANPPEQVAEEKAGVLSAYNVETIASWEGKYSTANPHEPLKAHRVETVGASNFVGRQVAWSPSGEWCIFVGSNNCALVLQRWKEDRKVVDPEKAAPAVVAR